MTDTFKAKRKKWLLIDENNLMLFEAGFEKEKPFFTVKAVKDASAALHNATSYASWVAEHYTKNINIILSNSIFQLILADVPNIPDHEIEQAMKLKASDLLNYDLDDAALDIIKLPDEAYRNRMRMAYIVAMDKKPIVQWLKELARYGIKAKVIDVEITQLRNLSVHHQEINSTGILHIENQQSRLILTYDKEMVLSRVFDTGLDNLKEDFNLQRTQLGKIASERSKNAIQFESLVVEIQRSLDYYESQIGLGSIQGLHLLCHEKPKDIASNLSKKLGMRFYILKVMDIFDLNLPQLDFDASPYYSLLGTAYRDLQ